MHCFFLFFLIKFPQIVYIIKGSTGGAFAIIYPTLQIICVENFDENQIESIVEDAIKENNKINIEKDIADSDPSSATWNHEYVTGKNKIIKNGNGNGNEDDHNNEDKVKEAGKEGVKIVLYGILGTSSFCKIHQSLSVKAEELYVRYDVRHAHPGLERTTDVSIDNNDILLS